MGFGILVIGYFMLINVPFHGVDLPPDFLGYILIFVALCKLGSYENKLKYAKLMCLPLIILSGVKLVLSLLSAFGVGEYTAAQNMAEYAVIAILLVFYFLLLLGIRDLATRVKLEKNARKSVRNLIIIVIFYVYTVIVNLYSFGVIPQKTGIQPGALIAIQQLFGYLVRFLNLIQFISCYMWICLEGDENMDSRQSALSRFVQRIKKEDK